MVGKGRDVPVALSIESEPALLCTLLTEARLVDSWSIRGISDAHS